MNINDLTIGQLKEIMATGIGSESSKKASHSIVVGEKYFIRTVTNYFTGKVVSVTDSDVVLSDAAWIADTGRFADAISKGSFSEVEPYKNNVIVNRKAIIDMTSIEFDLPRTQK